MNNMKWLKVISSYEVMEKQKTMSDSWRIVGSHDLPVRVSKNCPVCNATFGKLIVPIVSVSNLPDDSEDDILNDVLSCEVISVYHCIECNSLFAVKYDIVSKDKSLLDVELMSEGEVMCVVVDMLPKSQQVTLFSSFITSVFVEFVNLYHQAERAECFGLVDICGMGYRRALEFLVHTYVRMNNDKLPDNFNTMSLSQKIHQFIPNDDIKILAERAAWLGNDNVHIEQKHSNYSVEDMKQFISAIVSYIDFKQSVKKASEIQKK